MKFNGIFTALLTPFDKNDRVNDCSNPEELEILVYRGNNTFLLYEDDGESLSYQQGAYLKTAFTVKQEGSKVTFTIAKGEGDTSVSPEKRTYVIWLRDITSADVSVTVGGRKVNAEVKKEGKTLVLTVAAKTTAKPSSVPLTFA